MKGSALIAGCGIGGLAAALALQQRGFCVRLFEKSADFSIIGAGITLGPAATRAMTALGLTDALERASEPPRLGAMLHYKTNALFATTQARLDNPAEVANQYHLLHRADLHALLRRAVLMQDEEAIVTNHEVVGIGQDTDSVSVEFSNGRSVQGDFLIGADGLRSQVRQSLFGDQKPRFTGQVAYRTLIPFERAEPYLGDYTTAVYLGPERTLVRYLVQGGALVNCAAFVKTDHWAEESWSCPATADELAEHFEGWHPTVLDFLRSAPEGGVFKWALFDREPLAQWTSGRVTLLGDAAHPMLPFLGLGAAMAIEDAVVLGRAIQQEHDLRSAFAIYEQARQSRTTSVMLASRAQGEYFQSVDIDNFRPGNNPTTFEDYDAGTAPLASFDVGMTA